MVKTSALIKIFDGATAEMTPLEFKVFSHLGYGIKNAKNYSKLRTELDINRRDLCAVVESLRNKRYPVGSTRRRGGGYFIISNEAELKATISGYESQILKSRRVIYNLTRAHFGGTNE